MNVFYNNGVPFLFDTLCTDSQGAVPGIKQDRLSGILIYFPLLFQMQKWCFWGITGTPDTDLGNGRKNSKYLSWSQAEEKVAWKAFPGAAGIVLHEGLCSFGAGNQFWDVTNSLGPYSSLGLQIMESQPGTGWKGL